jgi:DNA-binding transcriptional LysR family regulator
MTLDSELLKNFIAIIENEGFTAASKKLYCTQAAVSSKLKRLESQLEKQLIKRDQSVPTPTEDGEVLLQYARKIMKLNEEVIRKLSDRDLHGVLRLGIVEYLATHRVSKIISRLTEAFPNLDLRLRFDLSRNLRTELEKGELDIIIAREDGKDSLAKPAFNDPLFWVANEELANALPSVLPLVFLPAPCFYRSEGIKALRSSNKDWYEAVTTVSISGVQNAVKAGLAIGILNETSIQEGMRILTSADGMPELTELKLETTYRDSKFSGFIEPLTEFICYELTR